jgi:nicotinate-nucleotide pyrophosphorylase (carboxylating)
VPFRFFLFQLLLSPHADGMEFLSAEDLRRLVQPALAEDVGSGDITTQATVPSSARAKAVMIAREPLVVAGLPVAEAVFRELSTAVDVGLSAKEGDRVKAGQPLLQVSGPAQPILTGERVALNFIQRLSGVATFTCQFVDAVQGTRAKILDTRKTTPGLRRLEKYAVTCGGGCNHRQGLYDNVLIKDNHLAVLQNEKPNPVAAAVRRARERCAGFRIEVEADTLEQVEQALEAGADILLLDNMNLVQMRVAVQLAKGRADIEASGGVNLANVRQIAETGVDYISIGAITHSARAVDIALDFEL